MTNLTERTGSFSASLISRQEELNACTTAQQVRELVANIIKTDTSLKKSAIEYGTKILVKLSKARDLSTAWQIVYNVILAGDNCGCFWSTAAAQRKRA